LAVTVTHAQPAPRPGTGKAAALGPFTALGAVRQGGSVLVSNAVLDWHLEFTPRADLTRRAPTDEELRQDPNLAAAFRYGPGADGPGPRGGEPPAHPAGGRSAEARPGWLDVEVETVRGQVKARPAHVLTLSADGPDRPRWQVQTAITVTPRWADVRRLVV